jgi:hypothetical protein
MIIALKPQRGDIKRIAQIIQPIHKKINTAKNEKYFQPLNQQSKLNH